LNSVDGPSVVKLRALYLSGDFNTHRDFHIREDQ
jgi:hypothetical protein